MRYLLEFLIVFVFSLIVLLAIATLARSECLSSAQDVWDAHPGSHATWSMRGNQKCWYARGKPRQVVTNRGVPLPRPAVIRASVSPLFPSRGLVAQEHDQFRTWAEPASTSDDLLVLQDRMISAGWRLWLQASLERAAIWQGLIPPLR